MLRDLGPRPKSLAPAGTLTQPTREQPDFLPLVGNRGVLCWTRRISDTAVICLIVNKLSDMLVAAGVAGLCIRSAMTRLCFVLILVINQDTWDGTAEQCLAREGISGKYTVLSLILVNLGPVFDQFRPRRACLGSQLFSKLVSTGLKNSILHIYRKWTTF